jgi:hypothetical protein
MRVALMGGVAVYGWLAISAFTRRPTRVFYGIRKVVNAAWLAVLYLVITRENPVPYLPAAGIIALALIVFSLLDRFSSSPPEAAQQREGTGRGQPASLP